MAWRRLRAPRAEMPCHSPFKSSERTCLATVRCLLHKRLYRPHHQHQTERHNERFTSGFQIVAGLWFMEPWEAKCNNCREEISRIVAFY